MSLVRSPAPRTPLRRILATLSCLVVCAPFAASAAAAQRFDAAGDPVLTSGQWAQLVVPADASALGLAELFGDDLSPALHAGVAVAGSGTEPAWVVYTYDAEARAYDRPALEDALAPGQAFWILQITGEDVTLDLPEGMPAVAPTASDACGTATGCVGIDLPTDAARASYAMIGSPSDVPLEVSAVRFATAGPDGEADGEADGADSCIGGCDLPAAAALGYTADGVWTYDPDAGGYTVASSGTTLAPWTGFWTVTAPGLSALAPQLLLPVPAEVDVEDPTVTVAGRVTTPDGTPVALARVWLADDPDDTVITGPDGTYSVRVPSGGTPSVLRVASAAHTGQLRALDAVPEGAALGLDIVVLERDAGDVLGAGEAVERIATGGAAVSVGAGALRAAGGAVHDGPVSVVVTAVDASNRAVREALPGAFSGIDATGAQVLVASLGAVEIIVTDDAGNALAPAEGSPVSVLLPLSTGSWPDGRDVMEGDAVPLWRLDEAAARWRSAGEGRVVAASSSATGLGLVATVDGFGWWNIGVPLPAARVAIEVAGTAPGTASILAFPTGSFAWLARPADTILRVGSTRDGFVVPADREICWTADIAADTGAAVAAAPVCLTPSADRVDTVRLVAPGGDAPLAVTGGSRLVQDGALASVANVGAPFEPVRLGVSRLSGAVTYAVTGGELPPGMALASSGATTAVLTGRTDAPGTWEAIVTATDQDGATAELVVRYTAGVPAAEIPWPPERDDFAALDIQVTDPGTDGTYEIALAPRFDLFSGTVAWSVEPEGEGVSVTPDGTLTVVYRAGDIDEFPPLYRWGGRVTAIDPVGTHTLEVELYLDSEGFVPGDAL